MFQACFGGTVTQACAKDFLTTAQKRYAVRCSPTQHANGSPQYTLDFTAQVLVDIPPGSTVSAEVEIEYYSAPASHWLSVTNGAAFTASELTQRKLLRVTAASQDVPIKTIALAAGGVVTADPFTARRNATVGEEVVSTFVLALPEVRSAVKFSVGHDLGGGGKALMRLRKIRVIPGANLAGCSAYTHEFSANATDVNFTATFGTCSNKLALLGSSGSLLDDLSLPADTATADDDITFVVTSQVLLGATANTCTGGTDLLGDITPTGLAASGWTLTGFKTSPGVAPECTKPDKSPALYGWANSAEVAVASVALPGAGTATLVFKNCWSAGKVNVYLDGKKIAAGAPRKGSAAGADTVSFAFRDSVLMLKDEEGNAVMSIHSLVVDDPCSLDTSLSADVSLGAVEKTTKLTKSSGVFLVEPNLNLVLAPPTKQYLHRGEAIAWSFSMSGNFAHMAKIHVEIPSMTTFATLVIGRASNGYSPACSHTYDAAASTLDVACDTLALQGVGGVTFNITGSVKESAPPYQKLDASVAVAYQSAPAEIGIADSLQKKTILAKAFVPTYVAELNCLTTVTDAATNQSFAPIDQVDGGAHHGNITLGQVVRLKWTCQLRGRGPLRITWQSSADDPVSFWPLSKSAVQVLQVGSRVAVSSRDTAEFQIQRFTDASTGTYMVEFPSVENTAETPLTTDSADAFVVEVTAVVVGKQNLKS